MVVTGSGRLDTYQKGGDSLLGRYDLYRLHPFTVGELLANGRQHVPSPAELIDRLQAPDVPAGAPEAVELIERACGIHVPRVLPA